MHETHFSMADAIWDMVMCFMQHSRPMRPV